MQVDTRVDGGASATSATSPPLPRQHLPRELDHVSALTHSSAIRRWLVDSAGQKRWMRSLGMSAIYTYRAMPYYGRESPGAAPRRRRTYPPRRSARAAADRVSAPRPGPGRGRRPRRGVRAAPASVAPPPGARRGTDSRRRGSRSYRGRDAHRRGSRRRVGHARPRPRAQRPDCRTTWPRPEREPPGSSAASRSAPPRSR